MIRLPIACATLLLLGAPPATADSCQPSGVSVQVLGSGGPLAGGGRASTGYLVWIDGRARVLVDAGGGSFLRFGEAGAELADLALVAITHLHPDHVSDLPALLWLSDAVRTESLPIAGPSGNDAAPAFPVFLHRLFNGRNGAFPMLASALGGPGRGVRLDVTVVDVAKPRASTVFEHDNLTVTAVGVPHGKVPALAYRVQVGDASIVFSGDQIGTDPRFLDLARGADVLVMHLAVGAGEQSAGHATPTTVGRVAREARVGRLIVSHLGPGLARDGRTLQPELDLEPALAEVKKYYDGTPIVATDLQCTPVR